MKKYLVLFLVFVIALSLCACDKDPQQNLGASDPTGNSSPNSDPTSNSSVPAHTHEYTSEIVAPACTVNGYTIYTCQCGDYYHADEVQAPGHDWAAATCTTPKTCNVCQATEGHLSDHSYQDGKCTACQAPDPDYKAYNTGKWVRKSIQNIMSMENLMIQTLCFDSSAGLTWEVRYFEYVEEPDPEFMEDLQNEGYLIKYNNRYYQSFGMGEMGELSLDNSNNTRIKADLIGYDSCITLERIAGNKLKVTAINGEVTVGLGSLTVGEIFTWAE